MSKLLLVVFLSILGCSGGCVSKSLPLAPPISVSPTEVDRLRSATVALVKDYNGQWEVFCTGVWVSPIRILTAEHCVKGVVPGDLVYVASMEDTSMVRMEIRDEHPVFMDKHGDGVDLALLAAPNFPHMHPYLSLASEAVDGEAVLAIGHQAGYLYSIIQGTVSATRLMTNANHNLTWNIQVDISSWYGSSGGPLVNTRGELLGVASFLTSDPPHTTFFVATRTVKKFLDQTDP